MLEDMTQYIIRELCDHLFTNDTLSISCRCIIAPDGVACFDHGYTVLNTCTAVGFRWLLLLPDAGLHFQSPHSAPVHSPALRQR